MAIKEKIEQLKLQDRRQLSHAFDHGISQYVIFNDNEFVAVHFVAERNKNFQIEETVGVWSSGKIKSDPAKGT